MATLSHLEAKRFYDRLGARQDWQASFEYPAVQDMIAHSNFADSRAVCEFGCGTGQLADVLLSGNLAQDATYTCLDVSDTMVQLADHRLERWAGRAKVIQTDGSPNLLLADGSCDRVITTYVLDLLSDEDIQAFLREVHRVLTPDGLFCNVNLTFGTTSVSKTITAAWQKIHAWRPGLLGGCRPLMLLEHFDERLWIQRYHRITCEYAICSEITVTSPHPVDPPGGAGP